MITLRETIAAWLRPAKYGYDGETCAVMLHREAPSPDIAMGVDTAARRPGLDVWLCLR